MSSERSYRRPTATLSGMPAETTLHRLRRFEELCAKHGVVTKNTRIERYRHHLEQPTAVGGKPDKGVFIDPPNNPIQHSLDRALYVAREVDELTWIGEGLKDADTVGLAEKLRVLVRGADFAALDVNTEARNTQFELRIASYLGRAGYKLDFSTLTDIVASRGRNTYYVECKRVASPSQLTRRVKEALNQLEERMPRSGWLRGRHGVVAVDVTRVAFPSNGLTIGINPDHSRDVIQDKLRSIGVDVERGGSPLVGSAGTVLWLQIHIPALVMWPPAITTRFSSLFLVKPIGEWIPENGRVGLSSMRTIVRTHLAQQRFLDDTERRDHSDPDAEPPENLQLRESVVISAGLTIRFDEDLLEELVATGQLPERSDDHVVVTIWPPGVPAEAEGEDFSYLELELLFDNLPKEESASFMNSLQEARGLFAPLILQRYPYVGNPTWIDDEGDATSARPTERL
jgi:hypothetical protein